MFVEVVLLLSLYVISCSLDAAIEKKKKKKKKKNLQGLGFKVRVRSLALCLKVYGHGKMV